MIRPIEIVSVPCAGAYAEVLQLNPRVNVTVSEIGVGCSACVDGKCDPTVVLQIQEYTRGTFIKEIREKITNITPRDCIHLIHSSRFLK